MFLILGSTAFAYLSSLSCIYWLGAIITSHTDIFLNSPSATPCSFMATGTELVNNVYSMNQAIVSVIIASTISSIGEYILFMYVLVYLILLYWLSIIGTRVFYNCYSLTKVELINGLKVMGDNMFNMVGVKSLLSNIIIPSTLTSIGTFDCI